MQLILFQTSFLVWVLVLHMISVVNHLSVYNTAKREGKVPSREHHLMHQQDMGIELRNINFMELSASFL